MGRPGLMTMGAVVCSLLAVSPARGMPPFVSIHPDIGACGMFDGNGNYFYVEQRPEPVVKVIITQSSHDRSLFTCKMYVDSPAGGHAVKYDGKSTKMGCAVLPGGPLSDPPYMGMPAIQYTTYSWQEIVSADGEAILTCHARTE